MQWNVRPECRTFQVCMFNYFVVFTGNWVVLPVGFGIIILFSLYIYIYIHFLVNYMLAIPSNAFIFLFRCLLALPIKTFICRDARAAEREDNRRARPPPQELSPKRILFTVAVTGIAVLLGSFYYQRKMDNNPVH